MNPGTEEPTSNIVVPEPDGCRVTSGLSTTAPTTAVAPTALTVANSNGIALIFRVTVGGVDVRQYADFEAQEKITHILTFGQAEADRDWAPASFPDARYYAFVTGGGFAGIWDFKNLQVNAAFTNVPVGEVGSYTQENRYLYTNGFGATIACDLSQFDLHIVKVGDFQFQTQL